MPSIEELLQEVQVPPEHPFFYSRVCTYLLRSKYSAPKNEAELIRQICSEEFDDLSRRLDRTGLQESCSVRNVLKTRLIATKLIGEDGELKVELLELFIAAMKENLYSIAPNRQFDTVRDEQILRVLEMLRSSKECLRLIRQMTRPVSNRLAEQIIRETLLVPSNVPITDVHVRRACLAAWLCTLRQSLGSCFATAPAILIQQEQPQFFLRDLDQMMNTGSIKRTYGGVEHSVPMSSTWGNGDLRRPLVLERDLNLNENKIWMAPGLIAAMDAVSYFPEEMAQKEKSHELHKRLQKALEVLPKPGRIIVTNAEELIRSLLLVRYELTEKQVEEYLNRPKGMVQSALIIHVPHGTALSRSKEDPYLHFFKDFEAAKTAFKALADNALLKAWEFTLASFSEINLDFARWNLYASLGVNHDDPGGIGECLYSIISVKVEHANAELKETQVEFEQIEAQMMYLEGRARSASTEKEINWVKMEYQSRQTELYHINQVRQTLHDRATKIANLHQFLMNEYDRLFFDYFQEVYDADIHDVASGPFDDCPAGFRLLYKHGRTNPSLWTRIYSLPEFIDTLVSFFTITESELQSSPQIRGIENEFSLIITQLVGHVRSDQFMETAFYRMAKAHDKPLIARPLENLDKVEMKPWVYSSGGSMSTLVGAYFRREEKPTEITRWVENETELLAYFIDSIKQLPTPISDMYLKDVNKSMLIHSPTHAFLLKPGYFKEAWTSDMYTYSWIKHMLVEPARDDFSAISIDEEMARDMIQDLLFSVPQDYRPRYKQVFQQLPYRLSVENFRGLIVDTFHSDRGLRTFQGPVLSSDEVDAVIYSHLPYIQRDDIPALLQELLSTVYASKPHLVSRVPEVIQTALKKLSRRGVLSAKRLLELAKAVAMLVQESTRCSRDIHRAIVQELRAQKRMLSAPVIVADSNWVKDYFACVVNPGTGDLEFWSVDFYGVEGKPISYWKIWLNGSRRSPQWGIFSKPFEYVAKS